MSGLALSHLFAASAGVLLALGYSAARLRRFDDAQLYVCGALAYGAMMVLYAGIGH